MESWVKLLIANVSVIGFLWFILQQITIGKVKQYLEPITAEEILRRENLLNSKLTAYLQAVELVCCSLASQEWKGESAPHGRIPSGEPPSETHINSTAAGLALFSHNDEIRSAFIKCFKHPSPADLGYFLTQLRLDLGYGNSPWKPEEYPYIFGKNVRDSI